MHGTPQRMLAADEKLFVVPQMLQSKVTALIGPSGCGKSTLLRSVNRMNDLIPGARVEGTVTYHGQDIYAPDVDTIEVRSPADLFRLDRDALADLPGWGEKTQTNILRGIARMRKLPVLEIDADEMGQRQLMPTDEFEIIQHVELLDLPIYVTEHRLRKYLDGNGNTLYEPTVRSTKSGALPAGFGVLPFLPSMTKVSESPLSAKPGAE